MRTTVAAGVVLFLVFAVLFAPAGMLRPQMPPDITLINPGGTLWHGRSQLIVRGSQLGEVQWDFDLGAVFNGAVRYDLVLSTVRDNLTGAIEYFPVTETTHLKLSGILTAASINEWLNPYQISLSGSFRLDSVELTLVEQIPTAASGTISWGGGPVSYILSGKTSTGNLPEMLAYLGDIPQAVVFEVGGQTPLMRAELLANGFAKIGITKYLTRLLNAPWPGGDPDHVVVLEVEEQVF